MYSKKITIMQEIREGEIEEEEENTDNLIFGK